MIWKWSHRHRYPHRPSWNSNNVPGERDLGAERAWGQSALQLLNNYYQAEDPRQVMRPNPVQREIWVRADLTVDPSLGITGKGSSANGGSNSHSNNKHHQEEVFHVRGIVDRLDMVRNPEGKGVALNIIDYKTGKAPTLKSVRLGFDASSKIT